VAGLAIVILGAALLLSTFLDWGSTTLSDYTMTMNGFGSVHVSGPDHSMSSFMQQQLEDEVESAVHSPGVWVALFGVVAIAAGAAFMWTAWRTPASIAVMVLGGIAFLVCIGNLINLAAMMGNTASYGGDYRVGFGLLAACALTLALIGVGITAFVLERMALGARR
jgi:hypothetical protein